MHLHANTTTTTHAAFACRHPRSPMKTNPVFVASLLTLFTVSSPSAAWAANAPAAPAAPPALPVLSVQAVETEDPVGYVTWVAKTNEIAKTKLAVEGWITSYIGVHAGADTGMIFNVQVADNFAGLLTRGTDLEKDPDILTNAQHYHGLRKLGPRLLLKATRFDGSHPDAIIFNTYANVTDEAGYAKAIDQLRGLFDGHGLKDARINVFRVLAGRTDFSHVISIQTPSMERLGAMLDAIGEPWMMDWLASAAKLRTVVRNATYREVKPAK